MVAYTQDRDSRSAAMLHSADFTPQDVMLRPAAEVRTTVKRPMRDQGRVGALPNSTQGMTWCFTLGACADPSQLTFRGPSDRLRALLPRDDPRRGYGDLRARIKCQWATTADDLVLPPGGQGRSGTAEMALHPRHLEYASHYHLSVSRRSECRPDSLGPTTLRPSDHDLGAPPRGAPVQDPHPSLAWADRGGVRRADL